MNGFVPRYLYHVTTYASALGIVTEGLDPRKRYPARVSTKSWFVGEIKVAWAIGHVAYRHGAMVNRLSVLRLDTHDHQSVSFKRQGNPQHVYWTLEVGLMRETCIIPAHIVLTTIGNDEAIGNMPEWEF